ncbi:hypothetical protein ITP53_50320 [Nonomuraea sp. K274]|uniref:Lipoprotein n=1 Tax=Nonomuraea cypriaca TaxID=1187855 RepID=A0A931F399_9ACTN|nr:hypothetical protein [Nonomuraea cypriaca]MBF8193744.1 hypothetical protein [Nonomuraea cypriaca]
MIGVKRLAIVGAAMTAVLVPWAAGCGPLPAVHAKGKPPAPLIGDVIIFNDEIVEPVSLPITTCGGVFSVLARTPSRCDGASRVSDDDA